MLCIEILISILFRLVFLGILSVAQTTPCLTTGSKKDFDKSRDALKGLERQLSKTASIIQTQIKSINGKVKDLDKDIKSMEEDIKRRQWLKFNDHCYHFGTEPLIWIVAQKRCRELGGYLAKADDGRENAWIFKNMMKAKAAYYWLGMADVYNGDWRWLYDGTKPKYTNWAGGRPYSTSHAHSKNNNCLCGHPTAGQWLDDQCNHKVSYVCESNICFS